MTSPSPNREECIVPEDSALEEEGDTIVLRSADSRFTVGARQRPAEERADQDSRQHVWELFVVDHREEHLRERFIASFPSRVEAIEALCRGEDRMERLADPPTGEIPPVTVAKALSVREASP